MIILPPSDLAVFNFLKEKPDSKATEVGEALYTHKGQRKVTVKRTKSVNQREWASKVIMRLKQKGLIYQPFINQGKWRVLLSKYENGGNHDTNS